jgi:transaldolase/glucose-6-phosphate isomerase
MNDQRYSLPESLRKPVAEALADWRDHDKVRRLWQRDASLWTNTDEAQWLGWLDIVEKQIAKKADFQKLADEIRKENFTDILLLGMGGSSLCPEVLGKTFGQIKGFPRLHVLDSTDPAQVKAFENRVELSKTLFIVSSKSGSTLEPNIFKQYFFERTKQTVGAEKAGSRWIAITDPGSKLEKVAQADKFRYIFPGVPNIGGRYSALSNFGVIAAAVMGLDVTKFLDRAEEMVQACAASVPVELNPGVMLGVILGTAAKAGRDKLTIIASPEISDLGAWLEQLVAESTGKQGKGIIPVDREQLSAPEAYGNDRIFAYLRLESAPDADQDAKVTALEKAGQPVIRVVVNGTYDLGQEFFRWEIATAVAGSIIGINAFNQPDVEASKVETRKLTSEYEKSGSLPSEQPIHEQAGIKLFADPKNASALGKGNLADYLRAHLNRIKTGDYFALLGYIQMNDAHEARMQEIRHAVRDAKEVATCLGFGPRFLHSTGQAYKGGPNSGVFLQITCDDAKDLPVPGVKYTFGIVKAAQARGDFQVLADRGRRALRIHLGKDVEVGLSELLNILAEALQ